MVQFRYTFALWGYVYIPRPNQKRNFLHRGETYSCHAPLYRVVLPGSMQLLGSMQFFPTIWQSQYHNQLSNFVNNNGSEIQEQVKSFKNHFLSKKSALFSQSYNVTISSGLTSKLWKIIRRIWQKRFKCNSLFHNQNLTKFKNN